MREIVSPLSGIASPFSSRGTAQDGGAAAAALIGTEYEGFALDFVADGYAIRTLKASDLLGAESLGFALELISNTYAVRI